MRYSFIDDYDFDNNERVSVTLWVQGCKFHCPSCHNKHTWDLNGGKEFTEKDFDYILDALDKYFPKDLSILGGEPLLDENINKITDICKRIKKLRPNTKIWLWTGYIWEVIQDKEIVQYLDVLIDGLFIKSLQREKLKFRGSANQRVIDVQKTLNSKEIVLYCE